MSDFDSDDVAAMRRENGGKDFRQFMRQQIADGKARREHPAPKPPPRRTGRPPGAWPTDYRPPEQPAPRHSAAEWTAALDEYREWLRTADHPEFMDQGQICGCHGCRPFNPKEDQ